MPGVPLNVIEDKAGATAKIGQSGQWIYVRDPDGHQGYVAAWYVEATSVASPAPVPASTPSIIQHIAGANDPSTGIRA